MDKKLFFQRFLIPGFVGGPCSVPLSQAAFTCFITVIFLLPLPFRSLQDPTDASSSSSSITSLHPDLPACGSEQRQQNREDFCCVIFLLKINANFQDPCGFLYEDPLLCCTLGWFQTFNFNMVTDLGSSSVDSASTALKCIITFDPFSLLSAWSEGDGVIFNARSLVDGSAWSGRMMTQLLSVRGSTV